ncbi:lysophospholipid acyltransferase family protein [Oceanobacter kriegii]|uniref:lysophospholipid acyltransferase family protein n=1 Tax=Oceanobacter kriegii TaxID=64972 RepID=UPI0003FAB610|nr:lysophospholipid acyltransferase family protein [Oceanobacter kriegii]
MNVEAISGKLTIGLIKAMGLLPLAAAQGLGRLIGHGMYWRRTRAREVARVNLGLCYPDLSDAEREQRLKQVCLHSGIVGAEMGGFWGKGQQAALKYIKQVHNKELLDEAMADERGLLMLAPHQGNWELINYYLSSLLELTVMFKPAKNPVFDQWMRDRRESSGAKLVPTTPAGVKALFRTLQKGGVAGFLPDQEPEVRSGVFVPFMGVSTLTPRMPFELLQRTKAQALFAYTVRRPNADGFDLYFMKPDDGIYSDNADEACAAMNRSVAAVAAAAPEQYQWTYKRFKRQPDGGKNPYKAAGVP